MATFGEIFNKIKYASGQPDLVFNDGTNETGFIKMGMQSANKIANTIAKGYMNEEIKEIILVNEQKEYAIPTGVDKIKDLYFTQDSRTYPLYFVEQETFLQLERVRVVSSRLQYWTIREGKINVFPVVSDASSLNLYAVCLNQPYNLDVAANSTSGQNVETNIKFGFEDLIFFYVMNEIYLQRENPQMSQVYKNRYDELFIRFRDDVNTSQNNPVISDRVKNYLDPNLYPILTIN